MARFFFIHLSSDLENLNIENQFSAKRNEVGIWKMATLKKTGFAFGCVPPMIAFSNGIDETIRNWSSLEWFGECLFLEIAVRFGAELAKWE